MSNTITLPRAEWQVLTFVLGMFIEEREIEGGSLSLILDNINLQLDNQEY